MDNRSDVITISNKKRLYTTSELKGLGATYYAQAYVPEGVVCLMSAAVFLRAFNIQAGCS